jgi:dCMP deaminase
MPLMPLNAKYHDLYWDMAYSAERQSVAQREQVGCVIVTRQGVVIPGWNGQPAGHRTNCCENTWIEAEQRMKTDRSVLHAENNAIGKATRAGICLEGAELFSTVSPCDPCGRQIIPSGIAVVHFDRPHDDLTGLHALLEAGITVSSRTYNLATLLELRDEQPVPTP